LRTCSTAILASASARAVPAVATSRKPSFESEAATSTAAGLSASRTESGRALGFGEGGREIGGARHHLAGRSHLRAENRVRAGETRERQNRGFDTELFEGLSLG